MHRRGWSTKSIAFFAFAKGIAVEFVAVGVWSQLELYFFGT